MNPVILQMWKLRPWERMRFSKVTLLVIDGTRKTARPMGILLRPSGPSTWRVGDSKASLILNGGWPGTEHQPSGGERPPFTRGLTPLYTLRRE